MTLATAARAIQARLLGEDTVFQGCSTDSRSVRHGELFIAIPGDRFDGHDFVGMARRGGAVAAMVESGTGHPLPVILVEDSRIHMGRLAEVWRDRFSIPVVAVTGSNGKTTVKEMISAILSLQAPTLSTAGNLNNDIGVPLTLFNLGPEHGFAVIEIGANHAGEISGLSRMVKPGVAIITQCAPAHLEGFGSIEGVAHAKAEIFEGLPAGGTAVINNDDTFAEFWKDLTSDRRRITFGTGAGADVRATDIQLNAREHASLFRMETPAGAVQVSLGLPGMHNIINALSATAACLALDIDLETVVAGLRAARPPKGRMQVKGGISGSCIIDDTYNANPASLAAALNAVSGRPGRHWLVLGDMGELGPGSTELHLRAGEAAREAGFERLYAIGTLSNESVRGFGRGAEHFPGPRELVAALRPVLQGDITILVKGSRAMAMERVVDDLVAGP